MSAIRPLERSDLEQAVNLYQRVAMPGTPRPMPELYAYFEHLLFDQPWRDPEIPSLVFDQPGRGIVALIASHTRHMYWTEEDRDLKVACSGQLVADPDFRNRGVGALLLRSYLKGGQDLTITDGATDDVRTMWTKFGGRTNYLASNTWTRVISPAAYAGWAVTRRLRRQGGFVLQAAAGLDSFLPYPAPVGSETGSVELSASDLVGLVAELRGQFKISPGYDERFAAWLMSELAGRPERGLPLCRKVVDRAGEPLGWYLAFIDPKGIAQVLQVGAPPERCAAVIDRLVVDAAESGASAATGRVEPHLYSAVRRRGFIFRAGEWALIESREPEYVNAVLHGEALMTRLDGEWWLMPQVLGSSTSGMAHR